MHYCEQCHRQHEHNNHLPTGPSLDVCDECAGKFYAKSDRRRRQLDLENPNLARRLDMEDQE